MLKHLNIHEMVALIAPWVNDAKRKALFLSIPEITALHPKMVQIHAELLVAQPAPAAVSPALQKIIDEATAVDAGHDALARAVSSGIDADRAQSLAEEPPDLERAKQAEEVQLQIFPDGMSIINASLLAESGNTARVSKLLKEAPEVGAFLSAIPVRSHGTLLDTAHRWVATGTKLGKLERQREEQEAKETTRTGGRAAMNALRARWIRLVSQVISNLELSDAPAEAIETIRGPVQKASERAAKRYGTGGADETGEASDGDAPEAAADSTGAV